MRVSSSERDLADMTLDATQKGNEITATMRRPKSWFNLGSWRAESSIEVTVPKRFGGGRAWLLEVPRSARLTRLTFLGRRPKERFERRAGPRSGAFALPAPASQCGYGVPDVTF